MRTNIVLDDELVAEAMRLYGVKTKREIVDHALRELVARHHQKKILDLVGEPLLDPDYDVGEVRRNMKRDPG
jgi:Arc/MetJ family transcription regulator